MVCQSSCLIFSVGQSLHLIPSGDLKRRGRKDHDDVVIVMQWIVKGLGVPSYLMVANHV